MEERRLRRVCRHHRRARGRWDVTAPRATTTPTGTAARPVSCTAVAGTNIALVKYWGKRDAALNLPATGSLSLTLQELDPRTTVRFGADIGPDDRVQLNGQDADARARRRVIAFLDLIRAQAEL